MASGDGRLVVSFNGEIYNYRHLRDQLQRQGVVFRSHSDTEVLLHLYAGAGAALCQQLRGMYAFAIWNTQDQSLFLARDPFGIKPLYLHDDGQTLRFASQVKALLAGGAIPRETEPAGLLGYWIWGHVPELWTLFQNVLSLEPGTWLKLARDGRREQCTFETIETLLRGDPVTPSTPDQARGGWSAVKQPARTPKTPSPRVGRDAVASARAKGERIVMTNSCFDLLHAGHVRYLEQARELGDRLIVAVNDDASVRRLKGTTRPINALDRRIAVLSALSAVDWVVSFGDDTPERLICAVRPDVLVKGGDYRTEQVAGREGAEGAGGRVSILPFVEGCSTTVVLNTLHASRRR
jgi:rfaE bifunctional protein nucleotidyltransferase chain/domain